MAVTISAVLQRIKSDLAEFLPDAMVEGACRQAGHVWRRRRLDPVLTLHLFILQVLHSNTALSHLRHLSKVPMTAAGFCKARMRLPLGVLQMLLRQSSAAMRCAAVGEESLWCGGPGDQSPGPWLRAFLVDGSSTITPDTPALDKFFGHPTNQKKGCSFPVPKLLGLFDVFTGLIVEVLCFPLFTHEMSQVWKVHPLLGTGDLLVGDRGFCSYVHLALLHLASIQACFRMHQRQIVSFRVHRKKHHKGQKGKPRSKFLQRLGTQDQLVCWDKPPRHQKPEWIGLKQYLSLPATLTLRELRYPLQAKGQRTREVTIVTTLLDPVLYPKEKIALLYGIRWQVETHLAELKTTLKMRKLKSQTVAGVQKELAIYCLVYNLVHAVMLQAAQKQHVTPDRISFLDTVRWLLSARVGEQMPKLLVNPVRANRHEPRVIKDLQDTYRKMSRPRSYLRRHQELTKRCRLS
jgi:hypothetical protein